MLKFRVLTTKKNVARQIFVVRFLRRCFRASERIRQRRRQTFCAKSTFTRTNAKVLRSIRVREDVANCRHVQKVGRQCRRFRLLTKC